MLLEIRKNKIKHFEAAQRDNFAYNWTRDHC